MTDPIEEITRSPHHAKRVIVSLRERLRQAQGHLPFDGRALRKVREHLHCETNALGYCGCPDEEITDPDEANLVCSDIPGSEDGTWRSKPMHKPVIDIDLPCQLVESSPGKFHLYINHEVPEDAYWHLLGAFVTAGIVEEGYVSASHRRGYSAVRHPNKLKGTA